MLSLSFFGLLFCIAFLKVYSTILSPSLFAFVSFLGGAMAGKEMISFDPVEILELKDKEVCFL